MRVGSSVRDFWRFCLGLAARTGCGYVDERLCQPGKFPDLRRRDIRRLDHDRRKARQQGVDEIVDGTIHLDMSGERGGNIVTAREYANFDFPL